MIMYSKVVQISTKKSYSIRLENFIFWVRYSWRKLWLSISSRTFRCKSSTTASSGRLDRAHGKTYVLSLTRFIDFAWEGYICTFFKRTPNTWRKRVLSTKKRIYDACLRKRICRCMDWLCPPQQPVPRNEILVGKVIELQENFCLVAS